MPALNRRRGQGHIYEGPDHSDCFGPPKRDMPPAGTPWAVPPGVAEKARMTDSGIPGCPCRFLESDELPFIDGNPASALPRISGSSRVGAIIGPRTVILGGGQWWQPLPYKEMRVLCCQTCKYGFE